jgi:hypothetical protein
MKQNGVIDSCKQISFIQIMIHPHQLRNKSYNHQPCDSLLSTWGFVAKFTQRPLSQPEWFVPSSLVLPWGVPSFWDPLYLSLSGHGPSTTSRLVSWFVSSSLALPRGFPSFWDPLLNPPWGLWSFPLNVCFALGSPCQCLCLVRYAAGWFSLVYHIHLLPL